MSLTVHKIKSGILSKSMNTAVYCPDGCENVKLPVLYFLHGRSGDETLLEKSEMGTTADRLRKEGKIRPLIIVCPNLDNSRGINSSETYMEISGRYGIVHKGRYEDYLIREVIPYIDGAFNTVKSRSGRYIGGISSGGYTALSIGLRHKNLFSRIGGHMPAIDPFYAHEDEAYFSDETMWLKYDPVSIAKSGDFKNISVFLDDGTEDEGRFFLACDRLYSVLKSKGAEVQNHLFAGRHNEGYFKANLIKYLLFYGV